MEQERIEAGMEKGGWSQGTQWVRNHCVQSRSNLGRLPAWLREWVSDGVLEPGQAKPFVPAAATFQSATDIYTPGLIERLACEPSACTPTPTHTHTHRQTHFVVPRRILDTVSFDQQRWEAIHTAANIPTEQNCKGWLMAKPLLTKVKFGFYFPCIFTSSN